MTLSHNSEDVQRIEMMRDVQLIQFAINFKAPAELPLQFFLANKEMKTTGNGSLLLQILISSVTSS